MQDRSCQPRALGGCPAAPQGKTESHKATSPFFKPQSPTCGEPYAITVPSPCRRELGAEEEHRALGKDSRLTPTPLGHRQGKSSAVNSPESGITILTSQAGGWTHRRTETGTETIPHCCCPVYRAVGCGSSCPSSSGCSAPGTLLPRQQRGWGLQPPILPPHRGQPVPGLQAGG